MLRKKLLFIGGGDLCLQILKMLVPHDAFIFYIAGRDLDHLTRGCNLLRLGCLQLGGTCTIEPVLMDLGPGNVEQNAEIIYRIRPDIIFNSASLHSWRAITRLPTDRYHALEPARFGPWLPMQLAPAYELMRAVKHSAVRALTVNAAYPDAVNVVLDKVGLAPETGAGGVANLIPAVRLSIARLAQRVPECVQVKMIAQQEFSRQVAQAGLPEVANYCLRYWIEGVDYSGSFDDEVIFNSVCTHYRSLDGDNINFFNATSAIRLLENLFADQEIITHVPGPSGLPGGYPVRVGMGRVLLALPYGVSRADAIAINQMGQCQDGIQAIHADGSVTFDAERMSVMEAQLGFSMSHMKLADVHQWAAELARKYQTFARSAA
jgi:hypothetical protein